MVTTNRDKAKSWMGSFTHFFSNDPSEELARLMRAQAHVAVQCAAKLRQTLGFDRDAIVAFEHHGDRLEAEIGVVLSEAFNLRFDQGEVSRIAFELDECVDRMRKVATHVKIYRRYFEDAGKPVIPTGAVRILDIIVEMAGSVESLIALLALPKIPLEEVTRLAEILDELETEADRITETEETAMVASYSDESTGVSLIAHIKLYDLLEKTTDAMNHVGSRAKSIARKGS